MSIASIPVVVPPSGDGPSANISALVGAKTVTLTGFFQGVYTLLASHNNTSFVPVLIFNSDGSESIKLTLPDAYQNVRVRTGANTVPSSTVTVSVAGVSKPGENLFATLVTFAPGGGGVSPAIDTAALFPPTGLEKGINIICTGGLTGTILVEGSSDRVGWGGVGTFQAGDRQRPLLGLSQPLEFTPLSTGDNSRYLRFTVDGQVDSLVTLSVGGRIPAASASPVSPSMPTLPAGWGRYYFIDGDLGDDAHDGYIDAPLGSTFTPAQSAAHAVKTTDRLDAVTPPLGNLQTIVRLWKPRANSAVYDKAVAGDALGSCDRRRLGGYLRIIDRGSDHTNSVADRAQLGCVTVLGGGPFTVASITLQSFTLTGGVFPDPYALTRVRAKITHAGYGDSYAPIQWGDVSGANDPSVVTLWFTSGPASPGDLMTLEGPGVRIDSYYETAQTTIDFTNATFADPVALGFEVVSEMLAGSDGHPPGYAMISLPLGSLIFTGSAQGSPGWGDEAGNSIVVGYSFATPGQITATKEVVELTLNNASLSSGMVGSIVTSLDNCVLRHMEVWFGAEYTKMRSCVYDDLMFKQAGPVEIVQPLHAPGGSPIIFDPVMNQLARANASASASYSVSQLSELVTGTVTTDPGMTFRGGHYLVELDVLTLSVGYGVRLEYQDDSNAYTPVSYDSLRTTGFEIVGGVKVVCHVDVTKGYPSNILLCPRGVLYRVWTSTEGSVDIPVGTILGGREGGSGPADDLIVGEAVASSGGPASDLVGVSITNTLVPSNVPRPDAWGWVLVASEGVVMVQRDSAAAGATFVTGHPVYLSNLGTTGGSFGAFKLAPVSGASYQVGSIAPIGPRDTDGPIAITWTYKRPQHQLAATNTVFNVTSSDVLVDVPGLAVYLEAGHTYKVRACLFANVSTGGSRVSLQSLTIAMFLANIVYSFSTTSPPALAQAKGFGTFGDPGNVIVETTGNGWWSIDGTLVVTTAGVLTVQFAQAVSNPVASTVNAGAYLEVIEQ
jgi:hypothetical protein